MPIQNEHLCSPPPPTDRSTQEMASPQRSHEHADVMDVNWPLDSVLKVASALIRMKELPVFPSSAGPQQEEGHAQVGGTCPSYVSGGDKARATEENRVSADDDVDHGSSLTAPGDPQFSSEEVVSNRNGKRNAIAHGQQNGRSNLLVGLAEPKKTLLVYVRKQKAAPECRKNDGFDGRARSSVATVIAGKSPRAGASRSHSSEQLSQLPCAMEDGRDKRCTRAAQAMLSALETHQNLNRLGAERVNRASQEVGEPSSAVFEATRARSKPISAHHPQGSTPAKRARGSLDEADPSFEPVLSKQARLEVLGPKPRGRPRKMRAEMEEANPPFVSKQARLELLGPKPRGCPRKPIAEEKEANPPLLYVANVRVLKDASNTQTSWGHFLEEEDDNRGYVKMKSMEALLKNGHDQKDQ